MIRCLASPFLLLLVACQTQPTSPAWDEEVVRQEVKAVLDGYVASVVEGDWERNIGFFADDPRFYWVERGQIAYPSHEEIVAAIRSFYPSIERIDFSTGDVRITPLSADQALASMAFDQRMVLGEDRELQLTGVITIYLEKGPQGWKFLVGHSSAG